MPRVIITEQALQGLRRCRSFLADKSPHTVRRAGQVIEKHIAALETTPIMGRPLPDMPLLRELIISFGDSGYVALYRHDPLNDLVYVLAFRHQKEVGY